MPPHQERIGAQRAAGRSLVARLFGDTLSSLPAEVDTLYVCVEGALDLVPLDALPLGAGLLGERFRIRRVGSFASLRREHEARTSSPRALLVGNLDYGEPAEGSTASFSRLPSGAGELRTIRELFAREEPRVLSGRAATRDAVLAGLSRSTHAHFATHGVFDDAGLTGLDTRPGTGLGPPLALATLAPLSLGRLALSGANEGPAGLITGEELCVWMSQMTQLRAVVVAAAVVVVLVVVSACAITNHGIPTDKLCCCLLS